MKLSMSCFVMFYCNLEVMKILLICSKAYAFCTHACIFVILILDTWTMSDIIII